MNSQGRRHGSHNESVFRLGAGPARGMPAKLCVVALLSAWMGYRSGRASQEKVALEKMMKVKAMLPNVKRDSDMIETTPLGRADTFGDNGGVGSYWTLTYPLLLLDASTGRIKCPSSMWLSTWVRPQQAPLASGSSGRCQAWKLCMFLALRQTHSPQIPSNLLATKPI